jgi:uncharacterized membrane protein YphA (DoxX/SURF4 family)
MLWRRIIENDYLIFAIRIIVGSIFIYASIDKIIAPAQFARIVYNYHLVPGTAINFFALILPWVEFICGLSLIIGIWIRGASLLANFLILIFIVALSINLFRGVDIECGCFSVSSKAKTNIISLLIRDIGLMALTVILWHSRPKRFLLQRDK